MFGRFCGLDAIHVLSVFRRDSGVLLCLSRSITVADGPVCVQREPHQGLADGARQLPDVTAALLCWDAIIPPGQMCPQGTSWPESHKTKKVVDGVFKPVVLLQSLHISPPTRRPNTRQAPVQWLSL